MNNFSHQTKKEPLPIYTASTCSQLSSQPHFTFSCTNFKWKKTLQYLKYFIFYPLSYIGSNKNLVFRNGPTHQNINHIDFKYVINKSEQFSSNFIEFVTFLNFTLGSDDFDQILIAVDYAAGLPLFFPFSQWGTSH